MHFTKSKKQLDKKKYFVRILYSPHIKFKCVDEVEA